MRHFMCKLILPRKTFRHDMDQNERALMGLHTEYWEGSLVKGLVLVYGPVDDPAGSFGLCVLRLDDGSDPASVGTQLCADDPIQNGGIGFSYEIFSMPKIVHATHAGDHTVK
jgi:hypothetical protein